MNICRKTLMRGLLACERERENESRVIWSIDNGLRLDDSTKQTRSTGLRLTLNLTRRDCVQRWTHLLPDGRLIIDGLQQRCHGGGPAGSVPVWPSGFAGLNHQTVARWPLGLEPLNHEDIS